MEIPAPGLSGVGPELHFKQAPRPPPPAASESHRLCISPAPPPTLVHPYTRLEPWEVGGRTGSRPFPRCPLFHLSSSLGKPVFQLSLGQRQWEKVTSWKVTYLRHDHTLPVPSLSLGNPLLAVGGGGRFPGDEAWGQVLQESPRGRVCWHQSHPH